MLLPMSSKAMADRASTKQNARQITIIFFIADILLFVHAAALGRRLRREFSRGCLPATRSLRRAAPVTVTPQGSHIPARM
jgi:hypothetical protein